jgi:Predicted metal-dependent hydrolase
MEYEVIRSRRRTLSAEIRNGRLIIRAPLTASGAEIRRFIDRNRPWIETHLARAEVREQARAAVRKLTEEELNELVRKAREVIPGRVAYYAPLIGVSFGKISVRKQKTRWGSCSAEGNLSFNCLLLLAPPEVLDSVVVHELCHRKFMNHSPQFYAEVRRVFPAYAEHHRWLKENGDLLLAKLG